MNLKKNAIAIIIIVLFIISGYFIYKKLNPPKLPSYLVEAVGSIDGDVINLNTKYPGRIVFLDVDTGDKVKKNELIAKLNSKEIKEKLNGIIYEIKAKQNELTFTKSKILNTIKKAKILLKIKQAQINIINADIHSIKKVIKQDKKDEKRILELVNKKLSQHHKLELSKLKTTTDIDKLKALIAKKEALLLSLKVAQKNLKIALSSKHNITAMQNGILALNSKENELKTIINEMNLKSPVNGFVDSKISNIGEVVGAGMPVVSIIDTKSLYLKIFVSELNNGKIRIGNKAEIFLDSNPNHPIKAIVTKIAQKAEFTPKEVAVRSDRITRVYEVHLKPIKYNPYLKIGLPAIGVVLIGKGKLPNSLDKLPKL